MGSMFGLRTHLSRRLMLYIVGSFIGATLLSIAVQYLALQPILERTRVRNVEATVENLSGLISQSLWIFNSDAAREAASAMLRDQFITGIIVNDHQGTFEFRGGDLADTTYRNEELDAMIRKEDNQALTVILPLMVEQSDAVQEGMNIGTLEVRSDNRLIEQQVRELAAVTLITTLVTIVGLQILVYLMVHRIVARPLDLFTRHVQDYAADLENTNIVDNPALVSREDEIGRLYQTFNQQRSALIERDQQLTKHRDQLEQTVSERTSELREANSTLLESLDQLKKAQAELIQNEKLASLGALVSGIAHEVNTPLGISITASSHLAQELQQTKTLLDENKLTKSGFEAFLAECKETEELLSGNLNRAAELIKSFKKVAVDQSSDEQRTINLANYVDEIILSLRPKLKHTQITVHNDVDKTIELTTSPGAVAQILTNLMMNSIIHGFNQGADKGNINISAHFENDEITLVYQDDGVGMDEQTLNRIYDPFFTTKRSEGGSGLGMNIVYNLITSKLNGYIDSESQVGHGIKITMTFAVQSE